MRPPAFRSCDHRLPCAERRHHVAGEPAELLLEFARRQALGPVDHVVLQAGILRLDRLDAVDHLAGRAAEPRLLLSLATLRNYP